MTIMHTTRSLHAISRSSGRRAPAPAFAPPRKRTHSHADGTRGERLPWARSPWTGGTTRRRDAGRMTKHDQMTWIVAALRSLTRDPLVLVSASVLGLHGVTVAVPLLLLLATAPTFFAAHGTRPGDVIFLTVAIAFLPPTCSSHLLILLLWVVPGIGTAALRGPASPRRRGLRRRFGGHLRRRHRAHAGPFSPRRWRGRNGTGHMGALPPRGVQEPGADNDCCAISACSLVPGFSPVSALVRPDVPDGPYGIAMFDPRSSARPQRGARDDARSDRWELALQYLSRRGRIAQRERRRRR